jgi:nicotinate-nucleotide adenylyltransferase
VERAVGVLGAAFNPPHVGHLVLAQEAAAQLALERVLLVPTGRAPHKEIPADPGPRVRLEMTEAAASGNELLEVDPREVVAAERSDEPSYTAHTLEELARDGGGELVWIMGADAAAGMEGWRTPERILELARVGIAGREGVGRSEVAGVLGRLGGAERARFIEMPEIGISSTMLRERVAEGRPIRYLVPEAVAELIAERGLYS